MRRLVLVLVLLLAVGVAAVAVLRPRPAREQGDAVLAMPEKLRSGPLRTPEGVAMRVRVAPVPARVGSRLAYRGTVVVPRGVQARFGQPEPGGEFTWSGVGVRRIPGFAETMRGTPLDTLVLDATLQVFTAGEVAVPGPGVRLDRVPWRTGPFTTRLPVARLLVLPTVTEADTAASLRGLRGPAGAPWWERIAWLPLGLAVLVLAALAGLVVWARRRARRPAPVAVPRPAPGAPRPDAAAEALAALAELRRERLPEQGRFGEHALALTRILRRWLECTRTVPRPGDTSAELVRRLRAAGAPGEELERLEGLLAVWDRLKFARAHSSVEEAGRAEQAVEQVVRGGPRGEAA